MTLSHTNLGDLQERHLAELIELEVQERGRVEYKRDLPGAGDSERKEFLADVCSFANAGGGNLVYGVDEENGVPTELVGLTLEDSDGEILKLEATIRDGMDPRLVGCRSVAVPLAGGRHALVIRVPRSFSRPHAVSYRNRFSS